MERQEFTTTLWNHDADTKTTQMLNASHAAGCDVVWLEILFDRPVDLADEPHLRIYFQGIDVAGFNLGNPRHDPRCSVRYYKLADSYFYEHCVIDCKSSTKHALRVFVRMENNQLDLDDKKPPLWKLGVNMDHWLTENTAPGRYKHLPDDTHPCSEMNQHLHHRTMAQRSPPWYLFGKTLQLSSSTAARFISPYTFQLDQTHKHSSERSNNRAMRYGRLEEDFMVYRILQSDKSLYHIKESGRHQCPEVEEWWASPDGFVYQQDPRKNEAVETYLKQQFSLSKDDPWDKKFHFDRGILEIKTSKSGDIISASHVVQMWFQMLCTNTWYGLYVRAMNRAPRHGIYLYIFMWPQLRSKLIDWLKKACLLYYKKAKKISFISRQAEAMELADEVRTILHYYNRNNNHFNLEPCDEEQRRRYYAYRDSFNDPCPYQVEEVSQETSQSQLWQQINELSQQEETIDNANDIIRLCTTVIERCHKRLKTK